MLSEKFYIGVIILLFLIGISHSDSITTEKLYKRTDISLKHKRLETARENLSEKRIRNLSKDSLYYLLSRYYYHKKVLDTALAFNHAALKGGENLEFDILVLRMNIYKKLGWKGKADRLSDSLKSYRRYRISTLAPEITLSTGAGGHFGKEVHNDKWRILLGDYETTDQKVEDKIKDARGPEYNLSAGLEWGFPVLGKKVFKTGVVFDWEKPFYNDHQGVDSANLEAGVTAGISILDNLEAEYAFFAGLDFSKNLSLIQEISLSKIWFFTGKYLYLHSYYNSERLSEKPDSVTYRSFGLSMYTRVLKKGRVSISISAGSSGYIADPMLLGSIDVFYGDLSDNGGSINHYYTDSTCSEIFDPSGYVLNESVQSEFESTLVSEPLITKPLSNAIFNAGMNTIISLSERFDLIFRLGWKGVYYPREYTWIDYDMNIYGNILDDGKYVKDCKTGSYYFLRDNDDYTTSGYFNLLDEPNYPMSSEPYMVERIESKRFDNIVKGRFRVSFDTRSLGVLNLTLRGQRRFTSSDHRLPDEIERYYFEVAAGWGLKRRRPVERL